MSFGGLLDYNLISLTALKVNTTREGVPMLFIRACQESLYQ